MAKAKRKRRRSSGLSGLGKEFLADLRGEVVHCVRYGKGASGQIRCKRFNKGAGKPNPGNRKRAGVKGKFRERSKIRGRKVRKGRTTRSKKRCIRRFRSGPKKGKCAAFAPTGKALKSASRRVKRSGKRRCIRRFRSGPKAGKCAKFSTTGTVKRRRKTTKRKTSKRKTKRRAKSTNGRRKGKGRCIKWSKGRTRCLKRAAPKARAKSSNGRRRKGTRRPQARTRARRDISVGR